MEHVKEVKIAISGVFATIFYLIGWQGYLLLLLVAAMVIDYISGSMAARKNNEWSASIAGEGRRKKAMTFLALIVALILDSVIWILGSVNPNFALPFEWPFAFTFFSIIWFILYEIGSTIENLVKYGKKIPSFLIKGIKILKGKSEEAGEKLLGENPDE